MKWFVVLDSLAWIIPDQLLVAAESYPRPKVAALRFINLVDGVVFSRCKSELT